MNQPNRPCPPPTPAAPGTERPAAGDSVTVTPSAEKRPVALRCQRCGQTWTAQLAPGRRPVVCPSCRPAHEADLAAHRMRQHRTRAQERAEYDAYVQARRVQWVTDRLLTAHPEAAHVLAEVPYELAADVVQELARRLAEAERVQPEPH